MFSTTAICGWNSSTVSNWKLDTSSTLIVSGVLCAINSITGVPIFPPTSVGPPASAKILPSREVVVVFPFEPVIATILPCRNRLANSSSPIIGGPIRPEGPHLLQLRRVVRHARRHHNQVLPPEREQPMPARLHHDPRVQQRRNLLRQRHRAARIRHRHPRPWSRRNSAAAIPLFPNPTTSTRLFFSSI